MQPLPAFIMFTVTAAIVAVFLIPASYERKSALVNFYWVGTWLFLALLAAISGGEQIVRFLGLDGQTMALRLQTALLVCFPIFVIFAWARLSGAALIHGLKRLKA
jgi:hypothetical protein